MEIQAIQGDISATEADAVCLGMFQGVREPTGGARAVDAKLDGALRELLSGGDFAGERGETYLLRTRGALPSQRVLLVGLGEREKFDADVLREAAAASVQTARKHETLATVIHDVGVGGLAPEVAAQAVAEGALLGAYRFGKYRASGEREEQKLHLLQLVESDARRLSAVGAGAERGLRIAEAVCYARDLANEPASELTPRGLAERAEELAQAFSLSCETLTERDMELEGMGGVLGVARGSEEPPRLIVLEHEGRGTEDNPVVLVGKGVTFDSGGLSLKAREGMIHMKYDMAGAAAVLGTMQAVASLKLPLRVVGLIPAVENLPSGRALKPGDVLKMSNGKTVEVTNTDAEGRLILADALVYAQRYGPRAVVDLATLTGACVVALGEETAGLFSNDAALTEGVKAAAHASGERVWELPLYDEYKTLIESEVADLKNSVLGRGSFQPGAIAAAKFLEAFVDYLWVHLDIAGVAFNVESRRYYPKKGATGYGVRLLTEWLTAKAEDAV